MTLESKINPRGKRKWHSTDLREHFQMTLCLVVKNILHQLKSLITNLRDTMLPSSAGRLLILLDERSRYTRLCSLAMSGGMRDSELSLRCRAVRWVRDHRAVLRLLTRPATIARMTQSFMILLCTKRKWCTWVLASLQLQSFNKMPNRQTKKIKAPHDKCSLLSCNSSSHFKVTHYNRTWDKCSNEHSRIDKIQSLLVPDNIIKIRKEEKKKAIRETN